MRKFAIALLLLPFMFALFARTSYGRETAKMGIHILRPEELSTAKELVQVSESDESWHYITVPFTIEDIENTERWEQFFRQAKKQRLIPIVRLATSMEAEGWTIPDRKTVVDQLTVLSKYEWPTDQKHVIIFNEVNHAKEWGGKIDPEEYARTFRFASNWAHAIDDQFVVMPSAMDLAAPNGANTMEAFTYLDRMYAFDENIFTYADAWNSHSYPNPGFAANPQRNAKNALNGFEYELEYLARKTDKDFPVYITETGWEENSWLKSWLPSYYSYAMQHVWSHQQVMAVTPFILKGSPGPFTGFSFLNAADEPTTQYTAFRSALEKMHEDAMHLSFSE